jgi:hypothetical protein
MLGRNPVIKIHMLTSGLPVVMHAIAQHLDDIAEIST